MLDAPIDSMHGQNVDVFEELARLPEPVPPVLHEQKHTVNTHGHDANENHLKF